MKTTLTFLQDFYCPLHKKWFKAADSKNNSLEIDVDEAGTPMHSFWYTQLKDDVEKKYFQITALVTTNSKPNK